MINNSYQPQMMNYTPGYNAYLLNPYASMQRLQEQQLPQQTVQQVPQQQNLQLQAGINGKMVAAVEQIAANDVPMDGSVAFFPKQDLSAIYVKGWNADGTINTITYKPFKDGFSEQTGKTTSNTEKEVLRLSDEVADLFQENFEKLFEKIEKLEERIDKNISSQKKTARTQAKESE